MSQPDFYTVFDECIARLRQGETPEACLADYPEQATDLDPALTFSAELLHLPRLEPAPESLAHGYEAMMGALPGGERPSWLASVGLLAGRLLSSLRAREAGRPKVALRAAIVLLVVMIVSAAFVISASAASLPGDTLYPVKRSWERTRLALTLNEPARQALESQFAEQRREEVQAVLELRRPVVVEFEGRLLSRGDDVWLVDGLSVEVGDETDIAGAIIVGQRIFIRAQVQTSGKLIALRIVGDERDPLDTAVPTDEPQPTRGPQPTTEPALTSEPTDRPTRQPTREATATRAPTPEVTATRAPEPTDARSDTIAATREPQPTNEPTDKPADVTRPHDEPTREPTLAHEPSSTHEPTPTPVPADKPTATREPTATHEATALHDRKPTPTATRRSDSDGVSDRPS